MVTFLQIVMFIYIVIAFFLTNMLAKKFVQRYLGKKWLRRTIILPIGCIIVAIALFILAAFAPAELLIVIIVPMISFLVGVTAHLSFMKADQYAKDAAANSPYIKKGKK